MSRAWGMLSLAQAGVYAVVAAWTWARWWPAALLVGLAALGELVLGGAELARRGGRLRRPVAVLALVAVLLLVGLHVQVAVHIIRHFTPAGGAQAWGLLGALVVAAPWLLVVPLVQLGRSATGGEARRLQRGGVAALLACTLGLPVAEALWAGRLTHTAVAPEGPAAAGWLAGVQAGADPGPPPEGPGPVTLLVTEMHGGTERTTQLLEGETLATALQTFAPRGGDAVVLEVVRAQASTWMPRLSPPGWVFARPGATAFQGERKVRPAVAAWRPPAVGHPEVLPGLRLPAVRASSLPSKTGRILEVEGWLATPDGATPLVATWAAPEPLDATALLEAAREGARMVARNQEADGGYAYIVKGPSGELGGGYNFPRHAGTTWFLARAAARFDDPELRAAARRGVDYMAEHTRAVRDGQACVLDPSRRDGKAWVGTTALALLAVLELGEREDLQLAWAAQVASAVDAEGVVRGDMRLSSATWPEQYAVTYAQGQGLLALAAAHRAGLPGVEAPLRRAAAHVEGSYLPEPGRHFFTLDEHWMCLAALVAEEVLPGGRTGQAACRSYLRLQDLDAPREGSPVPTVAGPAGGLAEAVVAAAAMDRRSGTDGPWLRRAMDYGKVFLAARYRPADAPLLGRAETLLGGFRDRPWSLDVQVDAVQHIGCALLGIEALLSGTDLPGAMP